MLLFCFRFGVRAVRPRADGGQRAVGVQTLLPQEPQRGWRHVRPFHHGGLHRTERNRKRYLIFLFTLLLQRAIPDLFFFIFIFWWANPGLFFVYFRFFNQTSNTFFTTNKFENAFEVRTHVNPNWGNFTKSGHSFGNQFSPNFCHQKQLLHHSLTYRQ